MGLVRFLCLETKRNHLYKTKTKPNRLLTLKPFKPNILNLNHLQLKPNRTI